MVDGADRRQEDEERLLHTWAAFALMNSLKAIGLAQATGVARVVTGSFATTEDAEMLRATYGPPPAEGAPVHKAVLRLQSIHRNELESLVPFFAVSYCYILTTPLLFEAWILLLVFTVARFCHTLFYVCSWSPWRSMAWGVACQAILIMAGRVAAWLLPSAAIAVQVVVNAPMALQWIVSLSVLGVVNEQRRRFELVTRRDSQLEEGVSMLAPPERLSANRRPTRRAGGAGRGGGRGAGRSGAAGRGAHRDRRAELELEEEGEEGEEVEEDAWEDD